MLQSHRNSALEAAPPPERELPTREVALFLALLVVPLALLLGPILASL